MFGKTTALSAVLAATAMFAVTAVPASAIYRGGDTSGDAPTTTTTAENTNQSGDSGEKKSCPFTMGDDEETTYYKPHGSTMKIYLGKDSQGNNKYQTIRCNDGTWEEVAMTIPTGAFAYRAASTYVELTP